MSLSTCSILGPASTKNTPNTVVLRGFLVVYCCYFFHGFLRQAMSSLLGAYSDSEDEEEEQVPPGWRKR